MDKIAGIYCIENIINGKKYIGRGKDVHRRMSLKHKECRALNNSVKNHGVENFKTYVLIYCEEFELDRLEIEYIRIFDSHISKNGYNISFGGNTPTKGTSPSKETRKKISESTSGEKSWMWGKHLTEATKQKIRKHNIGKIRSSESKIKQGRSISGEKHFRFGKKNPNSSSKYFSVSKMTDGNYTRWVSQMSVKGKRVRIGYFKTELDAAKAYDKYVIENNLPNPLNFPNKIGT